jgi:putative acyl-CoA dehydrogenase
VATVENQASRETHRVVNQPPPLAGYNVYEADTVLGEATRREGAEWAEERIAAVGAFAGSEHAQELGRVANENPPKLRTHDRYGHRVDWVEFHPAWHELLGKSVESELHSLPWRQPGVGAHVARASAFICMSQAEAGVGCPISMTYSVVPALRVQPELAAEWEPRILSAEYDPRNAPASEKRGALAGMGMTEKQGGSDVRANTTVARPVNGGGPGAEYELTGHKWFMSAPQCDAFLVLAQADGGISCFLFPRWTPDGERNRFRLQRLKDKLGNRSNASSEIEFDAASAWLVGEEGDGVRTIIEMVNHTRLDCTIGGAAGMRTGVAQALHHTANRAAFGNELIDQPLMRNVLADLCIESEAATISALRLARAYDAAIGGDEEAQRLKRVANAVLKYWITKRAPAHAVECLECFGGNGYVEESGMPRLFRESPLNSIWEGSGNVQCLDVLRAMVKSPASLEAFFAEVDEGGGAEPRLASFAAKLREELPGDVETIQVRARRVVEHMALALQASLLVRYGDPATADAFCASRLSGDWGQAFGTLPAGADFGRIIERHRPQGI